MSWAPFYCIHKRIKVICEKILFGHLVLFDTLVFDSGQITLTN